MFKLCAIVSSYFPDLTELENNIASYLSGVDHLIIWENTPKDLSKIEQLVKKLDDKRIEVKTTGQNEYLAKPFNICFQWAKEKGFTHMLCMDQDSKFRDNEFQNYLSNIRKNKDTSIGIFAPNAENFDQSKELIERDGVITSGSVYLLSIFGESLKFNEDFLIYMIDVEYCFRVKNNGYKIICFTRIPLIHKMGYVKKSRFGFVLNNYSAQSTYYIIRNIILTWKLYPNYMTKKDKLGFYKYKVFYRLGKIIFEDHSFLKIKAIILGVIHGHSDKLGKYDLIKHNKKLSS